MSLMPAPLCRIPPPPPSPSLFSRFQSQLAKLRHASTTIERARIAADGLLDAAAAGAASSSLHPGSGRGGANNKVRAGCPSFAGGGQGAFLWQLTLFLARVLAGAVIQNNISVCKKISTRWEPDG